MKAEWAKAERAWISRAIRLFRDKPDAVRLYTTDGEISACKLGVGSDEINITISGGGAINSGAVLTDMHDDEEYGVTR